jgi:hypothetical protein
MGQGGHENHEFLSLPARALTFCESGREVRAYIWHNSSLWIAGEALSSASQVAGCLANASAAKEVIQGPTSHQE